MLALSIMEIVRCATRESSLRIPGARVAAAVHNLVVVPTEGQEFPIIHNTCATSVVDYQGMSLLLIIANPSQRTARSVERSTESMLVIVQFAI